MHQQLSLLWIVSIAAVGCAVSEPPATTDRASAVALAQPQVAHVEEVETNWQCVTKKTFNTTINDLQQSCLEDGGDFQWDVIGTGSDVLNGSVICRDDQYAVEYTCA